MGAVDEDITPAAGADEGTLGVVALVLTPAVLQLALVHIITVEGVGTQGVALGAGTGVAAGGVNALLLAPMGPRLALVLVLAGATVWLKEVACVTRTDGSARAVVAHVLAATVVLQAGVDHLHVDHVTRLVVGAQLVALVAQTPVGTPGVAALLAAGVRNLALVLVHAGDLVVGQGEASAAGTADLVVFDLASIMASTIVHRTRVDRFTHSTVTSQSVTWTAVADDPAGVVIAEVVTTTVPHTAGRLSYAGVSVRQEAVAGCTATLVGTLSIDALMGAAAVVILTLVHIVTGAVVGGEAVPR